MDIIQASSTIPFIFPPKIINNDYFIDGCVKNIDGICNKIIKEDKNVHFVIKGCYKYLNVNTVCDYIMEILQCLTQNEETLCTEYTIKIGHLEEHKNKVNFNIDNSEKIKLFYYGLKCAKEKFNNVDEIKSKINKPILIVKDENNKIEKTKDKETQTEESQIEESQNN